MIDPKKDQHIFSITRDNPAIEYIIPGYNGAGVRTTAKHNFTVYYVQKIKIEVSEEFLHFQLFN